MTPILKTEALGECLVTGAAGFVGRNLVRALLDHGLNVRALVHRTPIDINSDRLSCIQADVSQPAAMNRICDGVDTVFHTAANNSLLGGRHAPQAYFEESWQTNVDGTFHLLDACITQNVKRFVHTSSVDVCFQGEPLPDMKETLPYATNFKAVYPRTKIAAEKLVLEANSDPELLTCAIRPDGIWGAESNIMIDSFLEQLLAGRLKVKIGADDVLHDNSHIDNLVAGHLLAARNLVPGGVAGGQAYFIGDGEPMHAFEFFRPLIEGLGYKVPTHVLPTWLLRPIMNLWQMGHFKYDWSRPMLSPHELEKVTVTHYASIEKARKELGYEPLVSVAEGMKGCVEYCRKSS